MRSTRQIRIKACEFAAHVVGKIEGDLTAAKLMALTVFFESYILKGCDATEREMRLLSRKKVKHLKVVAGGKL